ncbi:MAG: outer membrane protein assembly factor [Tannerellaceae bacterium]|jgi:outer membrane protein assembly factor BamA|nr:outer membrane protein assembly factor [Tannerellaceae bacterium]
MYSYLRYLFYVLSFVLLASCSATKFVGEGEYLLDRTIIKSDNKQYESHNLKTYLHQQPNLKAFGLVKWQLYVYGWSAKNSDSRLNKVLRKIGEPPVIMDVSLVERSADELERFFVNKGYMNCVVKPSIDTSRRKKAIVSYNITSNEPYVIENYTMRFDNHEMDSIAHLKAPQRSRLEQAFRLSPEEYTPVVKEGNLFDRDLLDKERARITSLLRRNGYYAFDRENIGYLADTSALNRVSLSMVMYPYRRVNPDGTVSELPHRPYFIKDVTIVTDYDPLQPNSWLASSDSLRQDGVTIIYGRNGRSLRPNVLTGKNYLIPGGRFNERRLDRTYTAFASMSALRNMDIRFNTVEENDTMKLAAVLMATPAKLHGFGADIEGTNSAGDFGAAVGLHYRHRNLFRGSEMFSVRIRGAYEALTGMPELGDNNYWELGGEMSLSFPKFLFPFVKETFRKRISASTDFRLSYNRQTRPEYERAILSGRWGYNWQNPLASAVGYSGRHTFNLLDIDYLFLPRISSAFLDSLPDVTRQYNYVDQFIVSTGYSYYFNNYNPQYRRRNTHSLRASVELAGNTLHYISRLLNAPKNSAGKYELFGISFSEYVKLDLDFSKGIVLDNRNRFALHLAFGTAVPYGNADKIPFERRYFSGGANSVRGWAVRSLGPGSMSKDMANFITQAGDIRLDANIEYRTKLFWVMELALFGDAGNIWTIRQYDEQRYGSFDFTRFYKEIAFSYGLGLRFDFDFVLFRFDVGFKAYDPQETGMARWALSRFNFTDNFAWHFGVGYPF